MKKIISTVLVIFLMILSFGFCGVASAQDFFEMSLEQFNEKGDFFEMSMEITEEYDVGMTGHMRLEMTGTETITVKGNSYDCRVASMKGSGEVDYYSGPEGTWKMTGTMHIDKLTEDTVKETMTMTIVVEYLGETLTMVQETTTSHISKESTWTSQEEPEIGNSWTVTSVDEIEESQTMDTPDGQETSSDTYIRTKVTENEYLKDETVTTVLGTFNCRVIKKQDEDDFDDDYSYNYLDKNNNLPIASEVYEDYDLTSEMELIAYRMGGESVGTSVIGDIGSSSEDEDEDEEEGLLGMGKMGGIDTFLIMMIVIIVLIVIILAVFAMRRGRRAAVPPPTHQRQEQYAPPGCHQVPQPQAPPPPPPPPPQSYQDTQRYCTSCGQPLNYMQQYQKWYCYTCQRYQ